MHLNSSGSNYREWVTLYRSTYAHSYAEEDDLVARSYIKLIIHKYQLKYCELVRKLEAAGDLIPESAYATKLLVLIPERFHNTVLHINRNHSTQPKYKTRDYRAASRPRTPTLPSGSRPSTSDQRCGVPGKPQKSRASTARSPVIIVVRRCRRKTGDMERGIDRKNINEYGRAGRGRGNNRQDHANNAAEDIFFLNEGGSDEEIGSEVKINMLNLNKDTNQDGEEQMTIIDSGASSNMTGYCNMLFDIEECQRQVRLTNHQRIDVDKMGKFKIKNPNGSTFVFTNVLYVPTLHHTLVSVPALTSKERVTVQYKGKTCSIKVGDRVSAEAKLNDRRMYQLTGKIEAAPDDIACLATDGATWHQRLGHPSIASTKEIIAATKDGPKQAM
ncbi:hypothetical protein DYB25_014288 [Aphanomyces astaci]|uniref:Retrovirus-related Pol polyprotein from transposon TNT 1-94-like beta-barrel domain-containing protein n=1 Tax=Aphanomyces astaci TaxID=112090 RepID=A0A396ZX19_APHAT|nr:hypothetical protein DYB25_014288 [Aphanomyces astaci]